MEVLSGAFRPGLIEAPRQCGGRRPSRRYPGHFAPASLKPAGRQCHAPVSRNGYPGHFAPASLKPGERPGLSGIREQVIRGISPRPH